MTPFPASAHRSPLLALCRHTAPWNGRFCVTSHIDKLGLRTLSANIFSQMSALAADKWSHKKCTKFRIVVFINFQTCYVDNCLFNNNVIINTIITWNLLGNSLDVQFLFWRITVDPTFQFNPIQGTFGIIWDWRIAIPAYIYYFALNSLDLFTGIKNCQNAANWFRCFKELNSQTQWFRFLAHPAVGQ